MIKSICIILSFGVCFYSFSMDGKEILKKMVDVYENTTKYEVFLKYQLFKDTETKLNSYYDGYLMRNKKQAYQKIDNTEFITTESFCLKISHNEKTAELSEGQSYRNQEIDFHKIVDLCKEILVEKKEDHYYLILKLKLTAEVPFSTVKVKIFATNFHLSQLDIYYSNLEDFSPNEQTQDLHRPHLRVIYSDFSTKLGVSDKVFNYSNYFIKTSTGDKLNDNLSSYQLIDYRIK